MVEMPDLQPGDSRMNTLHFTAFVTAHERARLLKVAGQLNVSEDCLASEAIRRIICFYEDVFAVQKAVSERQQMVALPKVTA
ncbi:MAG TPA: hypothetical protein VJ529_03120 [Candidatus Bathyarchaeia archaeon]|nr:hypothetical protein [Candidatus Bathyarchaeia archaeon]